MTKKEAYRELTVGKTVEVSIDGGGPRRAIVMRVDLDKCLADVKFADGSVRTLPLGILVKEQGLA